MKVAIAAVIAFFIGFGCRWFDIPTPAPPMLQGALLVVAMTLGYMGAGYLKSHQALASPQVQTQADTQHRSR